MYHIYRRIPHGNGPSDMSSSRSSNGILSSVPMLLTNEFRSVGAEAAPNLEGPRCFRILEPKMYHTTVISTNIKTKAPNAAPIIRFPEDVSTTTAPVNGDEASPVRFSTILPIHSGSGDISDGSGLINGEDSGSIDGSGSKKLARLVISPTISEDLSKHRST